MDNTEFESLVRHQGMGKENRTMHFANAVMVMNNVPTEHLDKVITRIAMEMNLEELLPANEDNSRILNAVAVIIGRILVKHSPHFRRFSRTSQTLHIDHEFSDEVQDLTVEVSITMKERNFHFEVNPCH